LQESATFKKRESILKITLAADLHMLFDQMNWGSGTKILVVAGDLTSYGYTDELKPFARWVENGPFEKVVVIAGNHDTVFQRNREKAMRRISDRTSKVVYLEDSGAEIDGLKFYGTPWTIGLYKDERWAFGLEESQLQEKWRMIPRDVDVLVTHSPPFGILDQATSFNSAGLENNCGSQSLLREVVGRVMPKVHVFGHIHEARGTTAKDGVQFVNAAMVDRMYMPYGGPIVVSV
jgi:Icc-related predicted phosphoesterase